MSEFTDHIKLYRQNSTIVTYLLVAGITIGLMMVFGVLMLLNQGGVIQLSDQSFYQFLTIHGTKMIGAAALAAAAIMWYFLNHYVELSKSILRINLILFLIGVLMVIIGVFSFDFAGGWTFLYPLPAISGGIWGTVGALLYLCGMLILGVGFLLFYIDTGRAIIKKYGSLGKGLGWDVISGKKSEANRSEEHTSELQSRGHIVCRLLLEKKKDLSMI